jgi:hypothetical protein
MPEVEIPEV